MNQENDQIDNHDDKDAENDQIDNHDDKDAEDDQIDNHDDKDAEDDQIDSLLADLRKRVSQNKEQIMYRTKLANFENQCEKYIDIFLKNQEHLKYLFQEEDHVDDAMVSSIDLQNIQKERKYQLNLARMEFIKSMNNKNTPNK